VEDTELTATLTLAGVQGIGSLRRAIGAACALPNVATSGGAAASDALQHPPASACGEFSVFHNCSNNSGMPWRATAEIVSTGAPASVA